MTPAERKADRRPLATTVSAMLMLVAMLCAVTAIASESVGATLLKRGAYDKALEAADAYNRLYTQVLPDPQARDVTANLLAHLPVDRSLVTANLRLVLPTATLRGLVDQLLTQALEEVRGGSRELDVRLDLSPVLSNVAQLANTFLGDRLAGAPTFDPGTVAGLVRQLLAGAADISKGQTPAGIPALPLRIDQAGVVAKAILKGLPSNPSEVIEPQLQVLLAQGDFAGALALLIPLTFPGAERGVSDLASRLRDGHVLEVTIRSDALNRQPIQGMLRVLHDIGGHTAWLTGWAALLGFVCLLAAGRLARNPRLLGIGLLMAGGTTVVVGLLGASLVTDPLHSLTGTGSPLAPQGRRLVADIVRELGHDVARRYLLLSAALILAGLALAAAPAVAKLAKNARRGRLIGVATASLAPASLIVSAALAVPVNVPSKALACNGFSQLCDRPYNQVVYAATHNSMANSEARFLGPSQDPSIVHQLDNGVRALLIDTHYWTPASKVASFLDSLPPATRAVLRPFAEPVTKSRPGTWLCHDICQLGATPLTAQLGQIHRWLQDNPDEVITLILQDGISVADTQRAVEESGLLADVATPPADPRGAWPTLREMINSGRRVYLFSEQKDVAGGWYRNFYRYASDTPFRNESPAQLACQLDRGSPAAPLLLVNNWVTRTASSRRDAARANSTQFLLHQARICREKRGRNPTFLAVDFAGTGQLMSAVNELNGVAAGRS